MLMRRARANSSSCSQVVLVYLHPFVVMHAFVAKSQQITKKPYFEIQGHSRSSTLMLLKRTSPVLVMVSSTSLPISTVFTLDKPIAEK